MLAVTGLRLALICFCLFLITPVQAQQETDGFYAAAVNSNNAYKQAVSYLRTGNIDFTLLELDAAIGIWRDIQSEFGSAPPAAYASDPKWRDYLAAVAAGLTEGREFLLSGDMEKAKKRLHPVRALHHEMRLRNNVVLFEDKFFEASTHMHSLSQYRSITVALANAYSRNKIAEAAKSFHEALLESDSLAYENVKKKAVYQRLMTQAKQSTPKMRAAIEAADYNVFLRYLRELRSLEQILYLHFG